MPPRLTNLHVRHYRLLDDVDFSPSPGVSVLLGANNSGKSNIIDALVFLKDAAIHGLPHAFERRHGFERIVSRHDLTLSPVIELTLEDGSSLEATVSNGSIQAHAAPPGAGGDTWGFHGGDNMGLPEPLHPLNDFFRD